MIDFADLKMVDNTARIILSNDYEMNELIRAWYQKAQEHDICIEVSEDCITSGGLLKKKQYPCLIISHPDHKTGYYRYCVMITTDATRTYSELMKMGWSKLESKVKSGGWLKQVLHGSQYEIEYRSEVSFYQTIEKIWKSMHE